MGSAISAISTRTDHEDLCQLTQNWHNGSHFVRTSKRCSRRTISLRATRSLRTAVGACEGSIRPLSCLRVIERDPETPWALVIAPSGPLMCAAQINSRPRSCSDDNGPLDRSSATFGSALSGTLQASMHCFDHWRMKGGFAPEPDLRRSSHMLLAKLACCTPM
jgi:hypothetical protein